MTFTIIDLFVCAVAQVRLNRGQNHRFAIGTFSDPNSPSAAVCASLLDFRLPHLGMLSVGKWRCAY